MVVKVSSAVPFQSTPPSREATAEAAIQKQMDEISIHASLTGGDANTVAETTTTEGISIHASLTGGDGVLTVPSCSSSHFNPRLPHGRRPPLCVLAGQQKDFNPRLPHGRRLIVHCDRSADSAFQSTPPSREATAKTTNSNPLQPVVFVILYSNPWYLIALIYKILVLNTSYSFFQVRTLQHIYERYTFAPLISYLANYSIRNLILCYIDIIIGKITR